MKIIFFKLKFLLDLRLLYVEIAIPEKEEVYITMKNVYKFPIYGNLLFYNFS